MTIHANELNYRLQDKLSNLEELAQFAKRNMQTSTDLDRRDWYTGRFDSMNQLVNLIESETRYSTWIELKALFGFWNEAKANFLITANPYWQGRLDAAANGLIVLGFTEHDLGISI